MARKNKPDHGSLKLCGKRWYLNVKLPGESTRRSHALIAAGQDSSTTNKPLAIELANKMWRQAEATEALKESGVVYDGTIPALQELFLEAHEKKIANKNVEVRKKELRFYRAALDGLVEYLKSVPFSLVTFELKQNRVVLWREYLHAEKNLCRETINKKVNVVKQMIRHAVLREIEPGELLYEIEAISPIKKKEGNFKDYKEVEPANWETVEKILPYLSVMIRDMLLIMKHTGARPGEVRVIRPCDIDQSDPEAWIYTPSGHKTDRYDIKREIAIGPTAQAILVRYLLRPGDAYCFPTNSKGKPYTTGSFAKVITRAVRAYNREHPKTPIKFHANQLRHAFATEVCLEYGLEVTRCVLGHVTSAMTQRYARRALEIAQQENAKRAVKKIG